MYFIKNFTIQTMNKTYGAHVILSRIHAEQHEASPSEYRATINTPRCPAYCCIRGTLVYPSGLEPGLDGIGDATSFQNILQRLNKEIRIINEEQPPNSQGLFFCEALGSCTQCGKSIHVVSVYSCAICSHSVAQTS